MSHQQPNQPNLEEFWAQELNTAQPEPSSDFLKRLDHKITTHAQHLPIGGKHMHMAEPSFSENGYHADMSPIYIGKPLRMPQLRWIAVASVVLLILMGAFLSFNPNHPATPTASVGQTDPAPVGQQVDECTITPQTGWVVHVVENETLADIAQHYEQTSEALMEANCLDHETLETGQVLYIPTQLSTVWVAREPIDVGVEINEELIQPIYVLNATTHNNDEAILGNYTLINIPKGSVIDDQFLTTLPAEIEYEGEIFTANDAEVVTIVHNPGLPRGIQQVVGGGSTLYIPSRGANNCMPFMPSEWCTDISFPSGIGVGDWGYDLHIPITILHEDADATIISLTEEDALILNQFELFYPDIEFDILSSHIISNDHVAIAIPMDISHKEQLQDIERNQAIEIELEFQFCDIETLDVTPPIILDEDMVLCDEDELQTETRTISAVLLLQSVIVGNDHFAGMVTVSVTPQDAVTLEWAIEAGIKISFVPIAD